MHCLPLRSGRLTVVVLAVVAGSALLPSVPAGAAAGTTVRVSVPPGGGQSTGFASLPAMSSDGTTVLFGSGASDLLPGITGPQLYVHDLGSGATELVTVNTGNGGSAGGLSGEHDIDADGSVVVFDSTAADLSADPDTDACEEERGNDEVDVNCADVFARDRADGQTLKLSVGPDGEEEANGNSVHPRVSDDGNLVVFASEASNLVAGDTSGTWDIFVRDLVTDTTRRLTSTERGSNTGEPVISADGSTVAFWSSSTTLDPTAPEGVNIFVYDLPTGAVSALPLGASESYSPTLSGDGSLVGFLSYTQLLPEDQNPSYDLYLHDRDAGTTELVNRNNDGGYALNSDRIELSDDGYHALFRGGAGLVPGTPTGQSYVYVRDLATGVVRVASLTDAGALLNDGADTGWRSLSPDGSTVAFMSRADNAVPGDTNGTDDVFVRVLGDLVPLPGSPGDLTTTLDGSGQAVFSGSTATPDVPVVAAITPPAGLQGSLTVDLGPSDPSAEPAGYEFFGEQLAISGPPATAAAPYVVAFTVDASRLGAVAPADVQVFRDGVAVADCTDPTGAVPDPCLVSRAAGPDGDAVVTVRTSRFSDWTLGRLAYQLSGLLAPVDPLPTVNSAKAGSAVPVTFRLGGDRGVDVLAAGYPRTTTAGCGGTPDEVEQTVSPGGATLSYDTSAGTYTWVWKTPKGTTGCRDLVLRFRDGSELTARFQLR
jgi:Tol biopolymer transport system component